VRVAYVSRTDGVHDRRFISAWRGAVDEVVARAVPTAADADGLGDWLRDLAPDVVQVGPVTSPGFEVVEAWEGPLIATSWGFDLMLETLEDAELERRVRRVLTRADVVFVDNAAVAERAVALGATPEGMVHFPWGLAPEWLTSPARSKSRGASVLSTRRHDPMYRVGDLVSAFIALAASFPDLRLTLAGTGSQTDEFQERLRRAGLAARVDFVGELDQQSLRQEYLAADLYVSTSSVDGTSISLLEAMASEVPVLVTRIPGNAQWVTPDTGSQFDVGDVDGLAQLLREWLTRADVREDAQQKAARAAELVRAHADWSATSRRFPEYAERAIARHLSRRVETRP
jgi:glycosyltransferase involved in cell wall biosynthesis